MLLRSRGSQNINLIKIQEVPTYTYVSIPLCLGRLGTYLHFHILGMAQIFEKFYK